MAEAGRVGAARVVVATEEAEKEAVEMVGAAMAVEGLRW